VPGGRVKKASIIGLGNIFKGDVGVACYVVDALWQEPLGDSVELSYLGEDSFCAGVSVCGTEFAIVVQAVNMGGPPGRICCWDKCAFERNFHWFADQDLSMISLARGFARAALSEIFPYDLMFLWIEPKVVEGIGISPEMRKALRKAVKIIKDNLFQRGFLPESAYKLSSIHQLEVLCSTV
jgi:hydrogenase maturation protease